MWMLKLTLYAMLLLFAGTAHAVVSVNKFFNPLVVNPGDVSRLTIELYNANTADYINAAVTDNLPAGVQTAGAPNVTNTCSGTVSTTSNSISLTGGAVPAAQGSVSGNCTISFDVVGFTSGNLVNTIPASAMTGTAGGVPDTNTTPASATLQVSTQIPISGSKAFTPSTIPAGGRSRLRITLNNNNAYNQPGVALTDNLPAGVTVASNQTGATNTCGGTVTATPGAGTVSLTGGTIPAGAPGSCLIDVYVTSISPGTYINTVPVGAITSARGSGATNTQALTANLAVQNQLQISKAFSPTPVLVGQFSTLTVTVTNWTQTALTGLSVTDNLPPDVTIYNPPNASTTCSGGVVTATPGAGSVSLATASLGAANPTTGAAGVCTFSVRVVSSTTGTKTNTIPVNSITTTESLTNLTAATSNLTVTSGGGSGNVTVQKNWTPTTGAVQSLTTATINPGQAIRLRLFVRLQNTTTNLTNNAITDTLPAGVVVANPPNAQVVSPSTCGGAVIAAAGSGTITYSGFTLLGQGTTLTSCEIRVNVTSSIPGVYTNQIPANRLTNDQSVTNPAASNAITLGVNSGADVTKAFSPTVLTGGGISRLTISITNTNASALTSVSLTDTLPSASGGRAALVASPASATTDCGGGTVTATPGTNTITLNNGTVPAQIGGVPGLCTVQVNVRITTFSSAYTLTNTIPIGALSSAQGLTNASAAPANIGYSPLSINVLKEFSPLQINGGQSSTLTVRLSNPSSVATLTGAAFTDTMPPGMIVFTTPNPSTTCTGGAITATPGAGSWTFSGGQLAPLSSCTVSVRVTSVVTPNSTNTIPAGGVTTANGATNASAAAATLTVIPYVAVSKGFNPSQIVPGVISQLTINVANSNSFDLTAFQITDNLPSGVAIAAPNGLSTTCSGTPSAGVASVSLTNGTIAANSTCQISVNVTSSALGVYTNTIPAGNISNAQDVNPDVSGAVADLIVVSPTLAMIASFRAYADEAGQVIVEWQTASEIGAAGFYLERQEPGTGEYVRVTDELLPSLPLAPQGGAYRYADATAQVGQPYVYRLVEVEARGGENVYGPYPVIIAQPKPTSQSSARTGKALNQAQSTARMATRYERVARQPAAAEGQHPEATRAPAAAPMAAGALGPTRISIQEPGLYYLSSAVLAQVTGVSETQVKTLIRNNQLHLTHRGESVAVWPATQNAGLYFVGEKIDSLYTDTNVYWLRQGNGVRMAAAPGGRPKPAPGLSFRSMAMMEQDKFAAPNLATDPDADYWYWECLQAPLTYPYPPCDKDARTLTVPTPGATAVGEATVRVYLMGATDLIHGPDHHVQVRIKGQLVGETVWDGIGPQVLTATFSQSLLTDGDTAVEVRAMKDPGVTLSIFYLDRIELDYSRQYRAVNDMLRLRADNHAVVTVSGLSSANVSVLEVSDPRQPQRLNAITTDQAADGYRVSFKPASAAGDYLVVGPQGVRNLAAGTLTVDTPSALRQTDHEADYLIISPTALVEGAEALATYRSARFKTQVVGLQDIYDEFNFGIADPNAIRDFLAYTGQHWRTRPDYVVLAGKGSYDHKNRLGKGGNLLPVLMAPTPWGLFASDNRFTDIDGDGLPDYKSGRIPAFSNADITAYVTKLRTYEANAGDWTRQVLLLADNPDAGGDFATDSDTLAERLILDGLTARKLYHGASTPAGATPAALLTSLNNGVGLFNYLGHGAVTQLGQEAFLTNDSVASLNNGARLPVFSALTCAVGNGSYPGFNSLAEKLLWRQGGGAIAAWAPTGLSSNEQALILDQAFVEALYRSPRAATLGDAVQAALAALKAQQGDRFMLDIYGVTGDPALIVH